MRIMSAVAQFTTVAELVQKMYTRRAPLQQREGLPVCPLPNFLEVPYPRKSVLTCARWSLVCLLVSRLEGACGS